MSSRTATSLRRHCEQVCWPKRSQPRAGVALVVGIAAALTLAACGGSLKANTSEPEADAAVAADAQPRRPVDLIDVTQDECVEGTHEATFKPVAMLIALDTSFSMHFHDKWPAARGAIESFVLNPAFGSDSVGLQYFPKRLVCSAEAYRDLAVPIASLAEVGHGGRLADAVASKDPREATEGTPMVPLLEGLRAYGAQWAADHGESQLVFVLATDGYPSEGDTCAVPGPGGTLPNTLDNVTQVAKDALTEDGVQTFAIGVGSELTALDRIATAGGTGKAILVDVGSDIEAQLLAALTDIRQRAIPCEFQVPDPPEGERIEFDQVNVQWTHGDVSETLARVEGPQACRQDAVLWFYDNPDQPTKIELCPQACTKVKQAGQGQVDVVFGCATILH